MTITPESKFYVVRSRNGATLAEVVSTTETHAVVRRLIGQKFRIGRHKTAKAATVPVSDIIRQASQRELALGYPV